MRENFNEDEIVDDFNKRYNTGRLSTYVIIIVFSFLLFIPFPLRET